MAITVVNKFGWLLLTPLIVPVLYLSITELLARRALMWIHYVTQQNKKNNKLNLYNYHYYKRIFPLFSRSSIITWGIPIVTFHAPLLQAMLARHLYFYRFTPFEPLSATSFARSKGLFTSTFIWRLTDSSHADFVPDVFLCFCLP